ncbi:hypothetical protein [Clostridium baratii]|uniref:hypothetical protein n=1 Tax=Clostridium baratii TaxID=1561 RepID=UPI0030CB3394
MRKCISCGKSEYVIAMHKHHVVSRKQQPALINCELNLVDICVKCHTTGPNAIHNKGYEKLKKLKRDKQAEYYNIFNKEFYTKDEVRELLDIKQEEVDKLLKHLPPTIYEKEDVIRACMGGKLI